MIVPRVTWTAALFLVIPGSLRAQAPVPSLRDAEVAEVRTALAAMRDDPRGPYTRILWFCADGTTQPPQSGACRERGGGVQHAERGPRARRLDSLFVHVGTILQALDRDILFDARWDHYRMRELVLQKFLFETDDGWALRRARYYRGARQIEDEEARGREFLEWLLSDPQWVQRNLLLAQHLVSTLPHATGAGDQTTQTIRNLATEVAALDTSLTQLRIKIHSFPSRADLEDVEQRLALEGVRPDVRNKLRELRDALQRQYDPRRAAEVFAEYRRRLGPAVAGALGALEQAIGEGRMREAFARTADLLVTLRQLVTTSTDGRANLVRLDLALALQQEAFVLAQDLAAQPNRGESRADRLRGLGDYFAAAFAVGFLSARERAALVAELESLLARQSMRALDYRASLAYLARSLEWSWGSVRGTYGPVHQRYQSFEPKAALFLDALVRGSILLPLSDRLTDLTADADRELGALHHVLGSTISQGLRGVNPGVALRRFEVAPADHTHTRFQSDVIYLLPETPAELRPVAGLLTMDAGNLLSHVQLLARNLGIPNAAVDPSLLSRLQAADGEQLFYAVSPLGRVLLKRPAQLTPEERALVSEAREARTERIRLDTSRLQLARWRPIPLAELRARHSGVVVGPKAANLGQLAADFPGRVAAGVALPFGMFLRHVDRPHGDADKTVLEELNDAYRAADRMRAAGRTENEIDEFMFGALARVREAIMQLEWVPEVRTAILATIRETFGDDVARGVFVRSDTNVEDLPQFSGAGLNLTVPHQTNVNDLLVAIRRVWTSPFSERAYLWRKQILADLGRIYPSVLLLASVHSDKSGVLISSGLQAGGPNDLTIATAEGVGGAVEGEDAETIVVNERGVIRLLSQAKAPYRRTLLPGGGVAWVATQRPDVLLTPGEIRQLRTVVREWRAHLTGEDLTRVWDIEFGFVGGQLWLFQIRPFVRLRSSQLLEQLAVLDRDVMRNADRQVVLTRVAP